MPTNTDTLSPNDPEIFYQAARAALDPDNSKWHKYSTGDEGPGIMELIRPQSPQADRYRQSEALRNHIRKTLVETGMSQLLAPTQDEAKSLGLIPNASPHPSMRGPAQTMDVPQSLIPNTFDISELQASPSVGARPEVPGRVHQYTGDVANPMQSAVAPIPARPSFYESPGEGTRQIELPGKPNMQAPLRPIQQQYAGANITAMTHPRAVQNRMTDAELTAGTAQRYEEIQRGAPEAFQGETGYLEQRLKLYAPTAAPGTSTGRKDKAQATLAEAEAARATEKVDAEIDQMRQKAAHDKSEATSITQQLGGRIREREAHIKLMETQVSTIGQKAELSDMVNKLSEAKAAFAMFVKLTDTGKMTRELENALLGIAVAGTTGLQTKPQAPGPIESRLPKVLGGETEGSGIELVPGSTPPPRGSRNPSGQALTPSAPPAQAPQKTAEELLKELQKANPNDQFRIGPDGTVQRKKR